MDSGKLPGPKNSANRIVPPSSAYWAAQLIERKRAEKTLEERYGRLRRQVKEQESQLAALSEALRRTSGGGRPPWLEGRAARDPSPAGGAVQQAGVELLRVDLERLQEQLRELRQATADAPECARQVEGGTPSGSHADREARDEEIAEMLRKQRRALRELHASLRSEREARVRLQRQYTEVEQGQTGARGLAAQAAEGIEAVREELAKQGAEIACLDERLEQRVEAWMEARFEELVTARLEALLAPRIASAIEGQEKRRVGLESARDAERRAHPGETGAGAGPRVGQREEELRTRFEHQLVRLQALGDEIRRESVARTNEDAAIRQAHAELQRRVADHSAVLRSVSAAMDRELASRREDQTQSGEAQKRIRSDVADLAARVRGLAAALEQEVSDRTGSRAHFDRAQANLDAQIAQQGETLQVLERRAADRDEVVERKLGDAGEARRALQEALDQVIADHSSATVGLERRAAKLDQRVSEQAAALEGLAREGAEERNAREGLQQRTADIERKLAEQQESVRALDAATEQEIVDRKAALVAIERTQARFEQELGEVALLVGVLERELLAGRGAAAAMGQLQEQLEGRLAECVRELRSVSGQVTRATTEAWREQGAERAAGDISGPAHGDATGREVALRPAGSLTVVADGPDAKASPSARPAGGDDIRVAINGLIGLSERGLDTELTSAAEAFRLREHLRDTLKPLLLRGRQKGLKLTCHIAPRVPDCVFGDPARLRQVMMSLVGNAIKFTDEGEVSVCIDTAAQNAGVVVLLISIVDTGPGMAPQQQEAVFDALMRTPDGTSGKGLGLPISAELIRLMYGRLWFESDLELGSKFYFTVRLDLEQAPRRSWCKRRERRRARKTTEAGDRETDVVLVADGNPQDRTGLKDIIDRSGATAVTVADGRGVLAALEHDDFDLIVMDLRMPGMDAFAAAATIRSLEGTDDSGVPIVTIGAQMSALDERRCRAVGVAQFLEKPVQAARLLRTLDELLDAGVAEDSARGEA